MRSTTSTCLARVTREAGSCWRGAGCIFCEAGLNATQAACSAMHYS